MNKSKLVLFLAVALILGWVLLFQGTQTTSASPLLGITLTPTRLVPQVTLTPVVPTLPPPPPPESTPVIIPVTGGDHSLDLNGLANLGLVFLALGLIVVGFAGKHK
jgi:hypothetical protein